MSFFWKDKSGRGLTKNFKKKELINAFLTKEDGNTNYDGETIVEWLEKDPDIGDTWQNDTDIVTRTE